MGNIVLKEDTPDRGEIVVYQPDDVTRLEVRVNEDTVWLTQAQLASLFQKDQSVIARHIRNVFSEGELDEDSNMHILHNTLSRYKPVKIYSLDVIISVGYRVKSFRGIQFRRWATTVLKEYMLKGYSINQRLNAIEDKLDRKMMEYEHRLVENEQKIDFFVRTSLPPVEGVFYDGQIFDAGVSAEIHTGRATETLKQDVARHKAQYPPIKLTEKKNIHDRFMIIDEDVYHIGASLKDLGKKLFAFSKMTISKDLLI